MKKYDLYYVTDRPILFRENLTEEQVDKFINSLTLAQRVHIQIKSKNISQVKEGER